MQTFALIAALSLSQATAPTQAVRELSPIDGFKRDFNAAKDAVRVVIILSPS
jgi:hypothetical protein